jgi:hypothetical protein
VAIAWGLHDRGLPAPVVGAAAAAAAAAVMRTAGTLWLLWLLRTQVLCAAAECRPGMTY